MSFTYRLSYEFMSFRVRLFLFSDVNFNVYTHISRILFTEKLSSLHTILRFIVVALIVHFIGVGAQSTL